MGESHVSGRFRYRPRVLIGTLYSGENEFEQSLAMLKRQTYTDWEHTVFRGLENREAHQTLYRHFMRRRDEFDLYIKLDADMVFRKSSSLEEIVEVFRANFELDHLQTPVQDWYTGLLLPAFHAFSNRAIWPETIDEVFADPSPFVPGNRLNLKGKPAPFVDHSPNPSPRQAFLFGVHRAVKAIQPGRRFLHRGQAMFQWHILKAIWERFEDTRDYRLGLSIYGADLVFRGKLQHSDYIRGKLEQIEYPKLDSTELYELLNRRWQNGILREVRHKKRIGLRYISSLVIQRPTLKGVLNKLR